MKKSCAKYLLIAGISMFLLSCEKAVIVPSDVIISQDITLTQKYNNMFQDIVNQTIKSQNITSLKTSEGSMISSANIKIDTINIQNIIYTVSFDGTPIGPNKIVISGTIIISANGKKHNEDGLIADVSSNGLTIDGIHINDDLKISILNLGTTTSYEETWSFTQDFTMTYNDGSFIDISGKGKRYQTDGYKSEAYIDDSYKLDIEISGTASNAVTFTGKSSASIIKTAGCKYFTGGTFNWISKGISKFVDYGNGSACDAIAIVTVDGKELKATQQ